MNRVSLHSLLKWQDPNDNDEMMLDIILYNDLVNSFCSIREFYLKFSSGRGLESDYEEIGPPKSRTGQSVMQPRTGGAAQCDLCGNSNPIVICQECQDQVSLLSSLTSLLAVSLTNHLQGDRM